MGKAYYYFAASLPMLDFNGKAPFTIEEFLEDCERLLDANDFAIIQHLMMDREDLIQTNNAVLSAWVRFQKGFRNEMAFFRAQKAGKDPNDYLRGDRYSEPFILEAIQAAGKAEDPLKGEIILSKVKWNYLDELTNQHYYDFEYIIAYALKVKILARYHEIRSPKGEEILEQLKQVEFPEAIKSL